MGVCKVCPANAVMRHCLPMRLRVEIAVTITQHPFKVLLPRMLPGVILQRSHLKASLDLRHGDNFRLSLLRHRQCSLRRHKILLIPPRPHCRRVAEIFLVHRRSHPPLQCKVIVMVMVMGMHLIKRHHLRILWHHRHLRHSGHPGHFLRDPWGRRRLVGH
jgi:hypothetical protein